MSPSPSPRKASRSRSPASRSRSKSGGRKSRSRSDSRDKKRSRSRSPRDSRSKSRGRRFDAPPPLSHILLLPSLDDASIFHQLLLEIGSVHMSMETDNGNSPGARRSISSPLLRNQPRERN
jgi:hypothetical protein